MHHGDHCVAPIQQRLEKLRADRFMRGEPSAADHHRDAVTVWLGWLKHIERERRAELASVNHVFGAREGRVGLGERAGQEDEAAGEQQKFFHWPTHAQTIARGRWRARRKQPEREPPSPRVPTSTSATREPGGSCSAHTLNLNSNTSPSCTW